MSPSDLDALTPLRLITEDLWPLIPWRAAGSTLIVLSAHETRFAQSLGEKQAAIRLARHAGYPVLLAWTGRYSTDIFRLDDLERVEALVAPASGTVRRKPQVRTVRGDHHA